MAVERNKALSYRSLHYKEWLIGLNVLRDMLGKRRFETKDCPWVFSMEDFHALIGMKVIQDSLGYVRVTPMKEVMRLTTRQAKAFISRFIRMGFLRVADDGTRYRRKVYYLTPMGTNALTNAYTVNWTMEYSRLMSLEMRFPTIKIPESKRYKKDAHGHRDQ